MRIIAGQWRGTPLFSPPASCTRPILDHVKEALFNILGNRLATPGWLPPVSVLDLFAGTGSLGLEALSRGAVFCTFVEGHRATARRLGDNIERLGAGRLSETRVGNAWQIDLHAGTTAPPYRLVFVDPPYRDTLGPAGSARVSTLLSRLAGAAGVDPQALIIIRHPKDALQHDAIPPELRLEDQRRYGDMALSFVIRPSPTPV